MFGTRPAFALIVVSAALAFTGCDLIVDEIKEGIGKPGGGGAAPQPPGPPPAPTPPGKPAQVCASSAECKQDGYVCSTTRGDCNRPPGCAPDAICPAVCHGVCEPPRAPERKCDETKVEGDETTCKTVGEWKLWAYETCRAKGLVLTEYSAGGGDCGPDSTRMVKYTCCTAAPPPPPPSPPVVTDPPPPGPTCFGTTQGGPTSCKSPEVWKTYASDDCTQKGAKLTDLGVYDDCGGGNYRGVKYVCCK